MWLILICYFTRGESVTFMHICAEILILLLSSLLSLVYAKHKLIIACCIFPYINNPKSQYNLQTSFDPTNLTIATFSFIEGQHVF